MQIAHPSPTNQPTNRRTQLGRLDSELPNSLSTAVGLGFNFKIACYEVSGEGSLKCVSLPQHKLRCSNDTLVPYTWSCYLFYRILVCRNATYLHFLSTPEPHLLPWSWLACMRRWSEAIKREREGGTEASLTPIHPSIHPSSERFSFFRPFLPSFLPSFLGDVTPLSQLAHHESHLRARCAR